MTEIPKCRETWVRNWRSCRCSNKAVTSAGYCRTHDPELKAARYAKRPPTRYEQWKAARRALNDFIDQQAPEIRYPLRKLYDAEQRMR